jgi:hypothetical protein
MFSYGECLQLVLRRVVSCRVVLCVCCVLCRVSCGVVSCVVSCVVCVVCSVVCRVVSCRVVLCRVVCVSCGGLPCRAVSCGVVSCHVPWLPLSHSWVQGNRYAWYDAHFPVVMASSSSDNNLPSTCHPVCLS